MNDTRSSLAAEPQYVSLREKEGKTERRVDKDEGLKKKKKGKERRVILILFMNGWFRMCKYVCIYVCV